MSFLDDWDRAVEDQINKAMEKGVFDNLPGKGKPIQWDDNPFADPDTRTAYHLLKKSGFTLPWIAERQEIDADLDHARRALIRSCRWFAAQNLALYPDAEDEWQRALSQFRSTVCALNKRIHVYNLKVPADVFQRITINVEREIEIIVSGGQTASS